MSRSFLISTTAILALGLAACNSEPDAPDTPDTPETAQVEQVAETTSTETTASSEPESPQLPPEIASVLEQARNCNRYAVPEYEMPERTEDMSDADFNALVSAAFLEANAQQPCVVRTSTGLQFLIRKASASGETPALGEVVRVHYHGQLIDGTVFDSSYNRFTAAEFPSDRLIAGWVEALQMMREGEAWTLFVPADIGYGPEGRGGIGPNQVMIFDMELLGLPQREPAE
jgi:FKBP-type peptidyl-prolyl cis-trans isomerase